MDTSKSKVWSQSRVLVFVAVLHFAYLDVAGSMCINGLLNPMDIKNYQQKRLIPLLGQYEGFGSEQWIFPNLEFTCHQMLTKWIFQGVGGITSRCRAELATWRLDEEFTFSTVFRRISTTSRNTAKTTVRNGSVFTYELARPVRVKPGDMVGIEIVCPQFEFYDKLNVLSLNISGGNGFLSYMRSGSGSLFFLDSPLVFFEQDYHPFIEAVTEAITPEELLTTTMTISSMVTSVEEADNTPRPTTTSIIQAIENVDPNGTDFYSQNKLKIIIVTCSAIITLSALVTVCVSVAWAKRYAKKHKVATSGRHHIDSEIRLDSSTSTGPGTLLHDNTAYNHLSNTVTTHSAMNQQIWLQSNTYTHDSQSETYEEIDLGGEGYERISLHIKKEKRDSMIDCAIYTTRNSNCESFESMNDSEAYEIRGDMNRDYVIDFESEEDAIKDSNDDAKMSDNVAYDGHRILYETDSEMSVDNASTLTTEPQERDSDHENCSYVDIL